MIQDVQLQMKTCTRCGQTKSISEFNRDKKRRDQHHNQCRDCVNTRTRAYMREYNKNYRDKNGEEIRAKGREYQAKNREVLSIKAKARRAANPVPYDGEKAWAKYIKAEYGLDQRDYYRLLDEQGGVCAICGDTNGDRRLAVDHCHETGKVRGLLCNFCNGGLGNTGDDVEVLRLMVDYLERHSSVVNTTTGDEHAA